MKTRFLICSLFISLLVACSPTPQGFDNQAKAEEAEVMALKYLIAKGLTGKVSLVRETNRKMKGYIVTDAQPGLDSQRVLCTVDLDTDMEKMLLICEQ